MHSDLHSALRYDGSGTELRMWFDRSKREPGTWREELFKSAHHIANTVERPLWLAISGGMDSEIMARSFFDQGINFSAITLEHIGGTNRDDVDRAKRWCFGHGVPHKIVPFDAKRFMTHDVDTYIKAGYRTGRIYRYMQIYLLEQVEAMGGYAVLGNGKLVFDVRDAQSGGREAFITLGTSFTAPFNWCIDNKTEHQPYFLFSSPELMLGYLRSPFIETALRHPVAFGNIFNNLALRRLVYQTEWPEIESRPPFLGFEHDAELRKSTEQRMRDTFTGTTTRFDMPASELVSQLVPNA